MSNYYLKHTGAEIDAGIDKANAALPKTGGTMSGALILNGDPALNLGAATKQYVDNASTAKAYANDLVETAMGDAKQYTDNATKAVLSDANAYADDKAVAVLKESKNYTDSKKPAMLTFSGGVSCTYDGSSPVGVIIPSTAGLASEKYVDDKIADLPTKLANPESLTFTGAASGTYDGSSPLTINIPSGGGGSGVSSWNDLTDRPFGVETRTLILKESVVVLNESGNGFISKPLNGVPVAGAKYVVKWSLETYECKGIDMSAAMGTTAIAIGNLDGLTGGEGTGEPFAIVLYPDGYSDDEYAEIHAVDDRYYGAHVAIKIESVEVSKIPEELLPTMPSVMFVNVEGEEPSEFVPDKSYLEAAVAMMSGQMVYLRCTRSDGIVILPCIALNSAGGILFAAPISTGMNQIYMWSPDGVFVGT